MTLLNTLKKRFRIKKQVKETINYLIKNQKRIVEVWYALNYLWENSTSDLHYGKPVIHYILELILPNTAPSIGGISKDTIFGVEEIHIHQDVTIIVSPLSYERNSPFRATIFDNSKELGKNYISLSEAYSARLIN